MALKDDLSWVTDPRIRSDLQNDFFRINSSDDQMKRKYLKLKAKYNAQDKAQTSSSSSGSSSSGAALVGAAAGVGAAAIGFGLKGIWKIIVFPFWLMFIMFKGLFYSFPRFLWRKGKAGRIICMIYIGAWVVAVGVQMIINHLEEKNAITAIVSTADTNFYFDDSFDSSIKETLPENTAVQVLKRNDKTGWAKIKFNNSTGYIELKNLTTDSEQEE